MAFGSTSTDRTQGRATDGAFQNMYRSEGLTLAAYAGAPSAAAADTGVLTTATPAANQNGIPSYFGKGRGNWEDGDQHRVLAFVEATTATAQDGDGKVPQAYVVSLAITSGDLVVTVHNRGLAATGACRITLLFNQKAS
jgi:hypothetical protein